MYPFRKDVKAIVGTTNSRMPIGMRVPFFATRSGFLVFAVAIAMGDIAIRRSWPGAHNSEVSYAGITPGGLAFYFYCKWWTRRRMRNESKSSPQQINNLRGQSE
jgi:hypothetical protein